MYVLALSKYSNIIIGYRYGQSYVWLTVGLLYLIDDISRVTLTLHFEADTWDESYDRRTPEWSQQRRHPRWHLLQAGLSQGQAVRGGHASCLPVLRPARYLRHSEPTCLQLWPLLMPLLLQVNCLFVFISTLSYDYKSKIIRLYL